MNSWVGRATEQLDSNLVWVLSYFLAGVGAAGNELQSSTLNSLEHNIHSGTCVLYSEAVLTCVL